MAPREPRPAINIRLSKDGLTALDLRAKAEARTRSDMIRLMLKYATEKMPKGWTP